MKKSIIYIFIGLIIIFISLIIVYFNFIVKCNINPKSYTQTEYGYKIGNRYQEFLSMSENYAIIPGLKEHIVPQSITYSSKYNKIFIIGYHKGKASSVIFVIDFNTKKLDKTLLLKKPDGKILNTHIGGLTTDDESIWLSDNYQLYSVPLNTLINTPDFSYLTLSTTDNIMTKGDYITFHEGILWIGEYDYKSIYKTSKEHHFKTPNREENKSLLAGYKLHTKIDYFKPDYLISTPERIQGLTFDDDNNFIFSRSFWSFASSDIIIFQDVLNEATTEMQIGDKKYNIWYLEESQALKNISLPPMSEGLFYKDKYIYLIFESASSYYRIYTHDKISHIKKIDISKIS